jgi:glycosyltransferase involved in cell wall biosynthesis
MKNQDQLLLSVILPVWKLDRYFAECLESILNQTEQDYEVLILTSKTEEYKILEKFKTSLDHRFKILECPADWTLGAVLNFGIRESKGFYIARMDADDVSLPTRFEKQILHLRKNENCSAVGSWGKIFGSEEWDFMPPSSNAELRVELFYGCMLMHPSVMMRREFIISNELFYDEELQGSEDYDLWSRWGEFGELANIPEILIKYRKHSEAATSRNQNETNEITKKIMRRLFISIGTDPSERELQNHHKLCTTNQRGLSEILLEKQFLDRVIANIPPGAEIDKTYFHNFASAKNISMLSQILIPGNFEFVSKSIAAKFFRKFLLTNRFHAPRIRRYLARLTSMEKFLWVWRKFSRSGISENFPNTPNGVLKSVLFLVGCPEGESERYRVDNICDYLLEVGVISTKIYEDELPFNFEEELPDLVVIFRTRMNSNISQFIKSARSKNIPLIFDIDDLVFSPELVDYVGAMRQLGPEQRPFHFREAQLQRRTLLMCNAATLSTRVLKEKVDELGIYSAVVPNSYNNSQFEIAQQLTNIAVTNDNLIRLGFFSGSPTHQKDFEMISTALAKLLRLNPHVRLSIVGFLNLPKEFDSLHSQIEITDFCHYQEMLILLSGIDVILVPLEYRNPFTAAKSELKIFEPSLVSVPAIVSGVDSYADTIKHGIDGFLVGEEEDWFTALSTYCLDKPLLREVGAAAKIAFQDRFHFRNSGRIALTFYQDVLNRYRDGYDSTFFN